MPTPHAGTLHQLIMSQFGHLSLSVSLSPSLACSDAAINAMNSGSSRFLAKCTFVQGSPK